MAAATAIVEAMATIAGNLPDLRTDHHPFDELPGGRQGRN
jgi:hypothetical protein